MYFFTELSKINTQVSADNDAYGPVPGNLSTQYETGANIQLNAIARAFAVQDGLMIVQPNANDANLVNIILRPIQGLEVSSETVQYYVYRGIQKADLITSGNVTNPGTVDIITNYWDNWTTYKIETGFTGSNPTPREAFGYDEVAGLSDDILIEDIFNNSVSTARPLKVSAGDWIGNFTNTSKINFEIVINSDSRNAIDTNHPDYLRMDLGHFRKSKNIIDVTDVDPGGLLSPEQKAFKTKLRREEVLSFIDPAAFYGLHYYVGVQENYYDGTEWLTQKVKKQDLYNNFIVKFETRNRVYIDIRSEYGYSLNFYDNYQISPSNEVINIKSDTSPIYVPDLYSTNDWPIFFESNWVGTNPKNRVRLKLRVGNENKNPFIYIDNPRFTSAFNKRKLIYWKNLPETPTPDYTEHLLLKFPNLNSGSPGANIAQYIRLQYFRQIDYDGDFPTKVIGTSGALNQAFGSLTMPSIDGHLTDFKHNKSQRLQYVQGGDFKFAAYAESYQDATNIVFFTEAEYAGRRSEKKRPKKIFEGNTVTESPIFPKDIAFQKVKIREDDGTGTYNDKFILQLVNYESRKKKSSTQEDVFVLGLTNIQHNALIAEANSAGLSNRHSIFIQFTPEVHLPEENGIAYSKYKLSLVGLNDLGVKTEVTPATDIFVYTQDEHIIASNEFTSSKTIPEGYPDPAIIKQWDHVGTWHYRADSTTPMTTIADLDGNNITSNEIDIALNANVFYPADYEGVTDPSNISSVLPSYPVIAIVHGNGHNFKEYDRILTHLAKNGFIGISIDCLFAEDTVELRPLNPSLGHSATSKWFSISYRRYVYDSGNGKYYDLQNNFVTKTLRSTAPIPGMVVDTANPPTYIKLPSTRTNQSGMGGLGRANTLFHHLHKLKAEFGSSIENNIGLLGHSRGGESILAAKRLMPSIITPDLTGINNVQALFSLSPTDQYDIEKLDDSTPYFMLYGSKDSDLTTVRIDIRRDPQDAYNYKYVLSGNAFSLWDRAENQKKTMLFMHGATHNGFVTKNKNGPVNGADFKVKKEFQWEVLNAYANAFFRQNLKGEDVWFDAMTGKWIPPSSRHSIAKAHFQYSDPNAHVLQKFDPESDELDFADGKAVGTLKTAPEEVSVVAADLTTNSRVLQVDAADIGKFSSGDLLSGPGILLGAKVRSVNNVTNEVTMNRIAVATSVGTDITVGSDVLDKYSQHGTKAIILKLSDFSTYTVYDDVGFNASSFDYFSFRITKKHGVATDLSALTISLFNGLTEFTASPPVEIPDTYKREDDPDLSKSAMITLRFPLADFTGLNVSSITKVRINFGTNVGVAELDDFEFSD